MKNVAFDSGTLHETPTDKRAVLRLEVGVSCIHEDHEDEFYFFLCTSRGGREEEGEYGKAET